MIDLYHSNAEFKFDSWINWKIHISVDDNCLNEPIIFNSFLIITYSSSLGSPFFVFFSWIGDWNYTSLPQDYAARKPIDLEWWNLFYSDPRMPGLSSKPKKQSAKLCNPHIRGQLPCIAQFHLGVGFQHAEKNIKLKAHYQFKSKLYMLRHFKIWLHNISSCHWKA